MRAARIAILLLIGVLATWIVLACIPSSTPRRAALLRGQVVDAEGPVAGARVRFKGTSSFVLTDADGRFALTRQPTDPARVTAWKHGYFIAGTAADDTPLLLTLTRLPLHDDEEYAWVDPDPHPGGRHQCANCHGDTHREWSASGHARSVSNRRFLNLYDGSDWQGKGGVGWNLLAEHPDGSGVCTACHAPTVAFGDPAYFDLRKTHGVARHGVHCDFCHKVADVATEQFGLTHGRFALKLLRPAEEQLFFGSLDDVDRGEDAFAPIYRDSRYCASCHEGTVFGVHVYSTYSEWLASPARQQGKQCQTCHMAPTGTLTNVAPGKGGIPRDPWTLSNHRFFVGSHEEMLRGCLNVTATATATDAGVHVEVEVRADGVGHRVPTGFADRNLVLVVEALGEDGQRVLLREGPTLPKLAGRTVAGQPGRLFAKQLSDFDGKLPVPFWRAQPDTVDTRLLPGKAERSEFMFEPGVAHVRVRLLYRRFWPEVAESKGWPENEVTVVEQTLSPRAR